VQEYYVEVGTSAYHGELYNRLFSLKSQEGLPLKLMEMREGAAYIIRCVYLSVKGKREEERLTRRIYHYYFARALAETIGDVWEKAFVQKVLKKEYHMGSKDIQHIFDKSWQDFNQKNYFREKKKHLLVKSILEFIDTHQRLNLEGFMNFRAKLYKYELKKQIACIVHEYILEQENAGFISSLQKFVKLQSTLYITIHMIIKADGEVVLLDEKGRKINYGCLPEGSEDKSNIDLYQDLIISTILKSAPHSLIIHLQKERYCDMLQMMEQVFQEQISFCTGCPLCEFSD